MKTKSAFPLEVITQRRGKAVCSSITVAKHFKKRHKNIIRDIEKIIATFNEGSKGFARLNFEPSSYLNQQNKRQPMYYMTRDGFTLLAMGFTGKEAMAFKIAYINQFNRMEQLLKERSSPLFIELREEGKRIRREETDVIKEFVEYAEASGSKSPQWYYKSFSDLTNRIIGISGRTSAGTEQEQCCQLAERIIAEKIIKGISRNRHYKEIYQDCKSALQSVFEEVQAHEVDTDESNTVQVS